MARKTFVLLVVVIALLSMGVLLVAAQNDQPNPPSFGYGMMGMMHRGQGMRIGPMLGMTSIAEALDMEPDALIEALQSGQTLAQIAEAQDVELQTVYDAMLAAAQTHMADLVAAGTLTQEQADEHLAYVRDHITEMPMFSGAGCQMTSMHGMGRMHHGQGMMGHGRGMRMGRHS